MHNNGQDRGEFLRCVDKKFVLLLRRNSLPPSSGGLNLVCVFLWNDWEKGMCPLCSSTGYNRAGIAQSVYRLATCWTVRGSNPCDGETFPSRPHRPLGQSSFVHNGHPIFSRSKVAGAWH
jgi:hypothetical protein